MNAQPPASDAAAIVTAAGLGARMGSDKPKQFLPLGGVPVLIRALAAVASSPLIGSILPVVPADRVEEARRLIAGCPGLERCLPPVAGGARRRDSVRIGFAGLPSAAIVLIHDGARPFVTAELIGRCIAAAREHGAALAAVRPRDTVKYSEDKGRSVARTLDRAAVWLAQTPQAFRREILEAAYGAAGAEEDFTDEAGMVERAGFTVRLVEGFEENIKLTTPGDMIIGEVLVKSLVSPGSGRKGSA